MIYAYIDESGDFGTHRRSTKNFILAALVTSEPRRVEKMVSRFRRSTLKMKNLRGELHAYHADRRTRIHLLKSIASMETIAIYAIVFKKTRQRTLVANADTSMIQLLTLISREEDIDVVCADVYSTKTQRENIEKVLSRLFSINFTFVASYSVKPIQAADFIAWALFQKYERGDRAFFDIIFPRIKKIVIV